MLPPALLVALALALRVAWVLLVPTKPVGDFAMYLESAEHLVVHGALDPEYVYMPGYILMLAAVHAAGGGWLAAKLLGAILGGLGAGAVYGIAHHLWDRRVALVAGLGYAIWPAGIVVASVTGTDMPAAVIIGGAADVLVRFGKDRPLVGAALFGAAMGLAGYVRAVALPLCAFCAIYYRAAGASWKTTIKATGVACVVAAMVLFPWAVRNKLRYGELFFTDSHGGLTALVGANPNSEGAYSRSLNRMFQEVTGYKLLAEPHRQADHVSYELAKDWTRFSPGYALGLVVKKAERLLANERPLLYWPLFRAGVLPEREASLFAGRRAELEWIVDAFWVLLVGAAMVGFGVAIARRRWVALAFVPAQLALVALYAIFFAEVRYHLPIALLLFPPAAAGLVWIVGEAWRGRDGRGRELFAATLALVIAFGGWSALLAGGAALRKRHAWAVHVCRVGAEARFCKWRGDGGQAPRGGWNAVGVATEPGRTSAATTEIPLEAGTYRLEAGLDLAPSAADPVGTAVVRIGAEALRLPLAEVARASREGGVVPVAAELRHPGGALEVKLEVAASAGEARIWLTDLRLAEVSP